MIGDVGQDQQEEVDHFPAAATSGRNFGWDCWEGTLGPACTAPDYRPPVFTYPNAAGQRAITGGVVMRDPGVPALDGRYLYVDHYLTDIRSLAFPGFTGDASTGLSESNVVNFGEDADGHVYVVSIGGSISRISGDPPALVPYGNFNTPMFLTGTPGRVFVAERAGKVRMVMGGNTTDFLDITSMVNTAGEGGLLSVAFPPDYDATGLFYVHYVRSDGSIQLDEFRGQDPASRRPVLTIAHPGQTNHYGGAAHFGPDGLLYISTGDGGGGGDPGENAQDTRELLGKVLRIDPRETTGSSPPPPPGPPPAPPPPPPPGASADTTPPRPILGGRRRQSMRRKRSVIVSAGCSERCRSRVSGTISVPGAARVYRLRGRQLVLEPGTRTRVILVAPRAAVKAIRARRRFVTALVSLRVRDGVGNTASVLRRFRVRG